MTIAKTHRPAARLSEMGRDEAIEITKNIKDNFDSLGAMLVEARNRKAYKALGYKSFEAYCQSEFGKSVSSAYQLIEDAKVLGQLEAKLSEEYGENITLKMPASHLKPLKVIDNIEDKLKAIEYAQKLATGEGKKATKEHLQIAVFEISGKRSEEFRSAIQKLGFAKGVQVETLSPIKKNRGIVRSIDKSGLVYVEHYYGENKAIPYRATELRILANEEKPTNPLNETIARTGDRVLIFADGLQGREGKIYTWREGKTALVMIDGQNSPNVIAYAEMELKEQKLQQENTYWESELVWQAGKNTYYYFPQEDHLKSDQWPTGLTLKPYTHSADPIRFMEHWENKFSQQIIDSLSTPTRLENLLIKQVIQLSTDEGRALAASLIDCLQQFLPESNTTNTAALQKENQLLREQLAEAEATIEAMVSSSKILPAESTEISELSLSSTANNENCSIEDETAKSKANLEQQREEIFNSLEQKEKLLATIRDEKKRKKLKNTLEHLRKRLHNLKKFEMWKVGQPVTKTNSSERGTITKMQFTEGGMPIAWVSWECLEEDLPNFLDHHSLEVLQEIQS